MNGAPLRNLTRALLAEEATLRQGGDPSRQKKLGRLTVRQRLEVLLDKKSLFFELGLWAGYKMYEEFGALPAAGLITGVGLVSGRWCMIIANDASVKAGAMFPQSVKKFLRAQTIAYNCRLPLLYLVDSSGVFLPLQDEIFPDQDDFGRIFRNNSVLSALGIPQFAAIMGSCIAGGGYLPVLCDKLLMTEGSGLYIAGPALVKAAIGQETNAEELGGAKMHAEMSGTVDFYEKDDESCLKQLRRLVDLLEKETVKTSFKTTDEGDAVYNLVEGEYDVHELLKLLVDPDTIEEYKASYGRTIVCAYAKLGGHPVGLVASQRKRSFTGRGEIEIGTVLYGKSADKAARFVMDCNQTHLPLIFLQDVAGFMVGKEAEQSGIIKSGAKLVNAVSNSTVPKITLIIGNSFGAGHYALCGKAYDPDFLLAWPNAKYAVMGAEQAAATLQAVQKNGGDTKKIVERYTEEMDVRYGAARGWIDAIIAPHESRAILLQLLELVKKRPPSPLTFHTGVIQT